MADDQIRSAVAEALGHTYAAAYQQNYEKADEVMVDRFLRLLETDGYKVITEAAHEELTAAFVLQEIRGGRGVVVPPPRDRANG